VAEWQPLTPGVTPVLDQLDPVITGIDTVLSFLLALLQVAQAILQVLQAFLIGLIDPLRAIVEALIAEARAIIADLRALGVYLTGDWQILRAEDKFSSVLGGYSAYERRMLARLLDTADPNRPNFSSSTTVLGAFLYTSSGDITELRASVNALLKFFGRGDLISKGSPYGTPAQPTLFYGTEGANVGSFRQLAQATEDAIPDAVTVKWKMPAPVGGISTAFSPAPKGFLIHVTTEPDGLGVLALTSKAQLSGEVEGLPRVAASAVDPVTNGPLRLYGGISDIGVAADSREFSSLEQTTDQQAPLLVLQKDANTPLILPSTLKPDDGGSTPLFGTTFWVPAGFLTRIGSGTEYSVTFPRSVLPKKVSFSARLDGFAQVDASEEATEFFFRVRAVDGDLAEALDSLGGSFNAPVDLYSTDYRIFRFSRGRVLQAVNGVLLPENPGLDGNGSIQPSPFTPASSPAVAQFPSAVQAEYIQAVQAAFAVAVLTRADLTESNLTTAGIVGTLGEFRYNQYAFGQGTGLEGVGRDLLAKYGISNTFYAGYRTSAFRRRLRWVLNRIASDLQERGMPPESLASATVTAAQPLLDFQWSEVNSDYPPLTILQSLGIGANPLEFEGVGANPFCREKPLEQLEILYETSGGPARGPSFNLTAGASDALWVEGEGSADNSPILFNDATGRVEYIRNALLEFNSGEVLSAASQVLQIAGASAARPLGDTQWLSIRVIPQGLQPADEILERIDQFLQGVLDGLDSTTDRIVAYINAIQARIFQLQALLNQIQALLRALDFFQVPQVQGLVVTASGTDALAAELIASTEKPSDNAEDYGAGIALVAGGIPTALLDLLAALLGSPE
jgi:hypothetical protein